jgi:hypothetical protein
MNTHLHPAGVTVTHFNIAVDDHRFADETHRSHADTVPKLLEFVFELSNLWIWISISHGSQARCALSKNHAGIL